MIRAYITRNVGIKGEHARQGEIRDMDDSTFRQLKRANGAREATQEELRAKEGAKEQAKQEVARQNQTQHQTRGPGRPAKQESE